MMSVLAIQNAAYKYEDGKMVFKNVNLSFEAGKVYTIVGKSGAGKSTLLYLLAGLDTCTDGQIAYQGKNLSNLNRNRYRARSVGVIFQGFNLLTNATALENILLSMHISGVSDGGKKDKAYTLLEKVGIDREKANRKVLKLSGGEQQRVGVAWALSHNPDLIIADEPTGNLDKATEDTILKILTGFAHDEGKCVIIVTHSKRVTAVADEIWGLDKGVFRQIPVH
jgi:putative ABC transport system ATP-binding protein